MVDVNLEDQAIFEVARKLPSASRAAYLQEQCGGDAAMRERVCALLEAYDDGESFLEAPAAGVAPALIQEPCADFEREGTQIGPYKLREVIGEGGFGLVYVAEQERPIRRKVALKLIKPGMDSKEVIARFEAERQALALMDHPNIAKVLDAGTTGGIGIQDSGFRGEVAGQPLNPEPRLLNPQLGRPYFVMELVRGLPITDYCDRVKLPLSERLKLFITVCQAVQHAHQKGIIHRDLKPSNVMITQHDGVPVPKIIDFGVAKALNQRLTEHTLYTRHAQMLGTPMYMSPEQAELSGLDVDARSDVYSLGVLLYELLTGQTPFDKESFAKLGYDELRRMVREVEPPRPSARVSTLSVENRSTVANRRGIDERQHSRVLKGELDWIVMKALEKDRTRRFGSADALAADLQRYLDDQPVEACPPSFAYRLRKFTRRKRAVVGAIALALATGVVSAVIVVIVKDRDGHEVARVEVPRQGSVTVTTPVEAETQERLPHETRTESFLPGLIPEPAPLSGAGRWQLIRRRMSTLVHHNWKLGWSPDSRKLVVGDGNDVRVYSVPQVELVRVYSGHENSVVAVDWSPDGHLIASGGLDNTVRIWDAKTGAPGPVLVGHHDRVDAVAWHPDSTRLASGGRDFTVRLWNRDGTTGPVLRGHTDEVLSVAWNRDGSKLATTGRDGRICIWSSDGQPHRKVDTGRTQYTVAWFPDGQRVLTGPFSARGPHIWDLDGTSGLEFEGHTNAVTSAALSPDGNRIVSASWDDTVRLWSIDGTPGATLSGFKGNVYSVAWSPDGQWIAAAGVDRAIRLFHSDGRPGPELAGSPRVICLDWRPDGEQFAASVGDWTIRICSPDGEQQLVLDELGKSATVVDWSPDGKRIVAGYSTGLARVWNVVDRTIVVEFPASEKELTSVAWRPHRPEFAVGSGDGLIRVWGADGSGVWVCAGHQGHVYELAWNPLNDKLATVAIDGTLRVWNVDGTAEGVFTTGELMASVTWKPDGRQLASGAESGAIQLWHPDGRQGPLLLGHADRVNSVDWSTDGRWLASGGRDNLVRVWTADGKERAILSGHTGQLSSVKWQPHRLRVLSGGSDGSIRLWDLNAERAEWISVVLRDGQSMKFDLAGRRLSGDAAMFEQEFAYIVEQPTGAMEIVAPLEFERRRRQVK